MNNKRYLEGDWTVQFWGHFPHCMPANQVPLLLVESCGNIFTLSFSQRSAPSARTATAQRPRGAAPLRSPLFGIPCWVYFQQPGSRSASVPVDHMSAEGEREGGGGGMKHARLLVKMSRCNAVVRSSGPNWTQRYFQCRLQKQQRRTGFHIKHTHSIVSKPGAFHCLRNPPRVEVKNIKQKYGHLLI